MDAVIRFLPAFARALGAALLLLTGQFVFSGTATAANIDDEILYLDMSGVIRVFDPGETDDSPLVQWTSPTAGWTSVALGDVNGDGDMEIVAVGTRSGESYLAVFDPVAVQGDNNDLPLTNGIPWELLYELPLPGRPRLVATGEFNQAEPAAEIIYSYEIPPDRRISADDHYRFVVLHGQGDGRDWTEDTTFDTGNEWTWITTGDVDNAGIDEVALADGVNGTLSVYRVGDGFTRIFRNSSSERPWHGAAIGQYELNELNELIAVREADYPLASAWAFRYGADAWVDVYAGVFIPSPRFVFLADITGNGDLEIVMLRRVPQELGNRPRIFIRDNGNDTFVFREATLDVDNEYSSGTGADVDGDGRDEIVIARPDRIRIYGEPETSTAAQDYALQLNSENIWSGNLDGNGTQRVPQAAPVLTVQPSQISAQLTTGGTSSPFVLTLRNVGSGGEIAYRVSTTEPTSWVSIDSDSGETPGSIVITLNANGLAPGTYEQAILIEPLVEGIVQEVESVTLSLVVDSGVTVLPPQLTTALYPCTDGQEPISRPLAVEGTNGISFTVSIEGSPDWLSVSPMEGTIPAILSATIVPSARDQAVESADITVAANSIAQGDNQAVAPVLLLCAAHRLELPYIAR